MPKFILQKREWKSLLVLLLMGFALLALVEDKVIDPWGIFSPRKFGIVVLLVSFIEFFSRIAVRFLGPHKSPLVVGFLAGLASSTTLTITAGKLAREQPAAWRRHAAMATMGLIASLVELILIVSLTAPTLFWQASLLVAMAIGLNAIVVAWLVRGDRRAIPNPEVQPPLDFFGVFRLAVLLTAILALVAVAQRFAGDSGRNAAIIVTGLFELHGVSLATATLYEHGQLSRSSALATLSIALLASFLAKFCLVWISARNKFSIVLSGVLAAMAVAVASTYWIVQL